jgi:hypothetical protein
MISTGEKKSVWSFGGENRKKGNVLGDLKKRYWRMWSGFLWLWIVE